MSLKRGDFALVYFPHSNLTTVKLRPVLVVQADERNTGLPQVVVAMVSSNLARSGHPSRVTVSLKDPRFWKANAPPAGGFDSFRSPKRLNSPKNFATAARRSLLLLQFARSKTALPPCATET
jgi:hypothetical protein